MNRRLMNTQVLAEFLTFIFLMYGECRGEPIKGQIMVAQVVMERDLDMLAHKQFSCFGKSDLKIFKRAAESASTRKLIINSLKTKVTMNQFVFWTALYINRDLLKLLNFERKNYYMTKKAWEFVRLRHPKWSQTLNKIEVVGDHIFFRGKPIVKKEEKEK